MATSKVAQISKRAKAIRKPGQSWQSAIKQASREVMAHKPAKKKPARKKRRKVGATKTAAKYRQTGSSTKHRDKMFRAKAPGKRKSASGKVYYERRKNRSDVPGTLTGISVGAMRSEMKRRTESNLADALLAKEKATSLKQHKAAMKRIYKYRKELKAL
jgi:hypothetical protein